MIRAILAADREWGIGKNNTLPWPHNSEDLKWFKEQTENQTVVMGRKTWESLPVRPLPDRSNIIVSNNGTKEDFVNIMAGNGKPDMVYSVEMAKKLLANTNQGTEKWIIGGAMLVETLLPIIDEIWISRIDGLYGCDTHLPKQKIRTWYHEKHIAHPTLKIEKWARRTL